MQPSNAYARQTPWSDPGPFGPSLQQIAASPATLADACARLMLHFAVAPTRGIAVPDAASGDVALRSIEAMLSTVLGRDERALTLMREPQNRFFGSCRHFALLAASRLRQAGIAARLRVGFADYFTPDFLVDHWVCEYDDGKGWRLLDPELDGLSCAQFVVSFPSWDVPRDRFRSAASVWQAIRAGQLDPMTVGVPAIGVVGLWFAAGSLMREAAALVQIELQPWDYWGPGLALQPGCTIAPELLARLDALADDLAREPTTRADARRICEAHAWAAVTPTVLSFPNGTPSEDAIMR